MDNEELVEFIERCRTMWSYKVQVAPNLLVRRNLMAPTYEEAMLRAIKFHSGLPIKDLKRK